MGRSERRLTVDLDRGYAKARGRSPRLARAAVASHGIAGDTTVGAGGSEIISFRGAASGADLLTGGTSAPSRWAPATRRGDPDR